MPDFKELVKNLYATKGRELTEEKLSYIETNYGKGKEEEFVKNFYATIGEELPQEKFDYIRDTYLKKKEDGGIPYRTPSAPVAPSFGTPSVVEASEQLESQSKLTPPQKGGVGKLDLSKGVPVKPLSGDMPEAAYQNILAKKEYDVKKEFERQKYDNQRYYRLKDKQQAQELGYTNVKDYYKDRETYIIQDNLDDLEQNEVRSYQRFIDAKRKGDDETANKELATYLDLKSKFRAEINSQKEALKAEKEAVKKSAMYQDFSPEQQQSVQESLDKRIANLDLALQPFYDPKAQLTQFVSDNKAEIASVSKPTQNAKEALEQYVNSQYTKVLDMKKSLGFEDGANALEEYAKEFQLRQQGRGDEVDKYYDEQAKLKNATKLLFLNRTPIDESETALGVAAKSFINSFAPKSKTEIQTNQAIANNIKQIVQDANIGSAVAKEQMDFAEEEAKPYAPYSANWFAEPIGGSAAFMLEFIPASIVTEGAFAATKLGRVVNAFENIRKGGKTLQTGAKYFDVLQKTKVGRGLLNAGAGGLKFGVTSKVVSEMFPSQEDEVNFTTGLTGGTSGVLASKLFGAGGGLAAKMMQRVFGNKAIPAARLISSMGDKIKRVTDANKEVVVGELFEEAGESLGQMWQQSDSGQEFMAKVKEQFGDLDNATQFTIQTLVMAIGMGHGTSLGKAYFEQGKDLYNALPRQSRAKVDQVMNEVKKESDVINDKVAEEIKKEEGITEQEIKQANPVMTQEQLDERLDEVEKRKKGELAQYEGSLDETYAVGSDETIGERIERVYETEKEQIKEEYDRAKEPIIGRTDVTQEGLGVATETGTQGVTREGVPSEEVEAGSVVGEEDLDSKIKRLDELSALGNNEYFNNADEIEFLKKEIGDATMQKYLANGWNDDAYVKVEIDRFNKLFSEQAKKQVGGKNAIIPQIVSVKRSEKRTTKSGIEIGDDKEWDIKFNTGGDYGVGYDKSMGNPYTAMMQSWLNEFHSKNKSIKYRESVEGRDNLTWEQLKNYNPLPKQEAVEQPLQTTEEKVSDALKDVESTARALEGKTAGLLKEPTLEQRVEDLKNKNISTFSYEKEADVPLELRDKISSRGEKNGEKFINVTLSQIEANYLLNKDNPQAISEAYHNAKAKPEAQRSASDKELITSVETLLKPKEYATQEIKQPKGVRTEPEGGIKGGETKTPSVSDSVQRAKESEKEREVRGEKPPTPEGSTTTLPPRIKGGSERVMVFKDGEWQERVGRETTKVSEKVKAEAQEAFAKPVSVKEKKKSDDVADSILQGLGVVEGDATMSVIESVRNALAETGIEIKVIENQDEYNKEAQKRGAGQDTEGMFVSDEGVIYINKNKIKDLWGDTIIFHEGTHPVINIIRNTNPKLFEKIVQGARELGNKYKSVADVLKFAEQYRMDVVENEDGNFDVVDKEGNIMATFDSEEKANAFVESKIADEFVTEIIARIASGKIQIEGLPKTLLQSIIDIMNKIFEALGVDTRITDTAPFAFKRKAEEIADALKSGRGISDIVGKKNVKEYMNQMFSPEVILGGDIKKGAISQSRITNEPVINVYQSKEVEKLDIKTLDEIYDEYNGKAVVINSDPTRVGFLKLPSGKTIFMYGGPAYLSIKDNVDGSVGFATTQISKVNTWNKYFKQLFGNKKGVTLVATQTPLSMLSNSYALRYVMDAISTLPKSVLKSYEFKNEFFGKNLVALKNAFGEKAYNDFVKKYKNADLSNPDIIDGMISEMAYKIGDDNKPASFKARGKFVSNLLAGIDLKSKSKTIEGDVGYYSKKPNKYIAKELFERLGLNTEKLLYELGEKELIDLYIKQGKWGFAVSGFETSPKISIELVQSKGVKHPLFNAKFPSSNSFLLDGAYEINKLFKPIEMEAPKGGVYTKTAAQMLAGSMYVKGERVEKGKSFEYSKVAPSYKRVQASKGGREEITLTDGRTVETKPLDVEVVNGFYSPIEKNVKEYGKDKIKAKDWLNVVGKGDEAVFTGVRAFLEEKDPNAMVSKQEILDYMKDNRISVVEVVLKEGEGKTAKERFGRNIELEGEKENYKEVLVTLPSSQLKSINEYNDARDELDAFERSINIPTEEDRLRYSELSEKVKELQDRLPKNVYIQQGRAYIGKQPFRSTHYDKPNILVHLRMNTRMGTWEVKKGDKFIDGNGNLVVATENTTQSGKVLFLEEVQSDWGQTGKKEGFIKSKQDIEKEYNEADKKLDDLNNKFDAKYGEDFSPDMLTPEEYSEYSAAATSRARLGSQLESGRFEGVPTAPFVMDTNAWTKLGLKVALKEAVKQGADKIAWTTGEQQNDRYDLRKQVDEIGYSYNEASNTYRIVGGKNGSPIFNSELKESELESNLGKDVASKIISDKDNSIGKMNFLRGNDLAVGGKGMKGFYGSMEEGTKGIVGGVAEKVFGQKVGKTDIIQQKGDVWEDNKGNWNVTTIDAQGNENTTKFSDKRGAESYANLNKFTVSQPSIDVTPALRAEVQRGLAQFSLGGRENVINKIKDSIKNLREQGFSDSDIIEGLNKIKDQIGLTDADIKDIVKGEEKISDAKEREVQNNRALSYGYKNIYHALNSVNKETGESYEKLSDVPDSVLEEVAKKKAKIETPKGKRRFTQQFIKQYPELAEMLSEDIVNYAKMPNNISVDMANAFIEEVGLEEARAAFADMSSGLPSGARMTLGQLVIKKLEEAGRVDEAIDVLEQVTTRATEMGQEIQALSMWAFLTPQGQLRYAQKTVNKAVERRKKQDKSKTDKLKENLKKANQEAVDETLQDPKVRGLIEKTDSIIPKGLPTPETKKPKKYIVSDDRVAFLKKQIKGKLFSGIPTELIELGVAYVERGAYKFSDFSRAMIKEFGNKIKPYLKEVYTKATETLIKEDYDKSNFDSADNIDKQVAQQKADEAVEKVEKAIKAGNKKALAQAIANLQKVAKQNGLWGQYKKYAVSRLKQLTIQNISDDVKKNPPLDEFTKGLVQNIKSMMMEKAEPKEREKIAKRPAIEVIADAFKNPEAYKEVLEETQKEMRKKYKDDVESLEMLDEYFGEFFDKPFSSKLVGTAIKEAMKEMNITISDIVTSHYTVYDATKKSLVDKLVEQAGLSESEASVLAKAIEKEFDKIATEKKQKLLEKILSNKKRKTPEAKSLEQELIRLTNLGAFSDSDVMSKWAEKMGYPKLTQEQVKEIQKLADAVQRAGKGFERFRAIEDLLSYQANLKGVSQLDVAISIWYANILSGFTTQTINTVANLLNSAILYGNAVAQNPKNAKFIASGFIEGFKRGLIEAKETFRTGYSPIRGKVEVPPVLERVKFEGFSKPLEYAKFIGRLMKAADVLVFEALKEMRAYQLAAKQAAKTSALEPSQSIKDKAAEILGKSDYIIEEATETAELWYENKVEEINESNLSKEEKEKALKQAKIDKQRKLYEYLEEQRSPEFQSEVADYAASGTYNKKPDGILGWMASVINQAKDKLNIAAEDATNPFQQAAVNTAKVFANAIVPFTNIIANVANESLNYTPVGIARRISGTTALTYNKKELTDQQKVDLMTKAVIGNSLMVAIYLLATLPAGDDDEPLIEITANGTGDYRKNYELQADGWMPYSVRIGKKRISYQYTPFMIPLSFIGNIKDYEKYRGEKLTDMAFGNQAAVAFGHTFRTLLDMTALSSLNKFLSASLDPRNENKVEDLLKASERTATSVVVPNLFTQSAKYIESAFQIPLKETSDQRFGNVLQHIPYVRNKYYDKLNALGEPIMPDTDKFLSTSKDEPIWGLIANKKAFIGKPSIKQMKRIDAETGQERFYTQEEYYNYGAIRGALIKEAIIKDFDKINAMSDKDAQEYIGSIKNEANMIARLAAESGKDEQSRSKIIETTKKSLEKDKAEKAKSEERKKKEEAKMSPQQIKYMNELDAISSKAGKIQYIINLKEKSGTTWYNVKKDIRKVISNDLIKDLKDLEKEGAIPKLGIAIKEKFD